MTKELVGFQYLQKNEIVDMKCDMSKPFAFISYSHDDYDSQIAMNVFKALYTKGINIWIDTANMPVSEDDWKDSAIQALMNQNCKFAFFFRSESSMVKRTIATELEKIKKLRHIGSIVTIDIWHEQGNNAGQYYDELLNAGDYKIFSICEKICNYVSTECKALRLADDMGNNIEVLVDEILHLDVVKQLKPVGEPYKVPVENDKDTQTVHVEKEEKITPIPPQTDEHKYMIFGKEYHAVGRGWQSELMYDAFSALVERHPEKAEALTAQTSVARAESVTKGNTQDAQPKCFRGCRKFTVEGVDYYVGTSFGFDAKVSQIKGMFQICGEDVSQFVLDGEPLIQNKKPNPGPGTKGPEKSGFQYRLWNEPHTAGTLAGLIHDVFDLIAAKYSEKIKEIARDDKITAVAFKADIEEKKLSPEKLGYFNARKEHTVEGLVYYVSTRYNREQGIEQLERMLAFCEGTSEAFELLTVPEKATHNRKGERK